MRDFEQLTLSSPRVRTLALIERSPAELVRAPSLEVSRERVLSDHELRAVWKASLSDPGAYGRIVRQLVLTAQRREEVAAMSWDEINFRTRSRTLAGPRTKAGRLHVVPLSEAALAAICVVPRAGALLFASQADPEGDRSFSGWTKAKARLDSSSGVTNWRLHDLRRTAATGMARLGVSPPVIERLLNHAMSSAGPLAAVYQRYGYAKEKRDALAAKNGMFSKARRRTKELARWLSAPSAQGDRDFLRLINMTLPTSTLSWSSWGVALEGDAALGAHESRADVDSALGSLVLLLSFLDKPVTAEHLQHDLGKGSGKLDVQDVVRLARRVDGVKARRVATRADRLTEMPLPAIARLRDETFLLLLRADDTHALILKPSQERPEKISLKEFELVFSGELVLVTTREQIAGTRRAFDVTWFIPALVKYRHLLRDVLLASLFLQILGLISPLFFQVVIDKVLVHKGLTTLEVLAFGLLVVSAFEVLMGGLRTYLFSHTTSRVDAELGSKLFTHLTSLPMAYFGARRVGDTVARVRELDTIREFLTSSALTVVLDLLFTVIFLAVMWIYSPMLLIIVLITLPLYALVVVLIGPMLRRKLDEKFARGAENQSFLVESVTGVETLKAMAVEPQMRTRWEGQLAAYVKASFQAGQLANWGSQAIHLIQKLGTVALLFFGARLVINGELTVGELVAFNMFAGQVAGPVLRLAQLAQDFQQARIAVARLGDILNAPAEPQASITRSSLPDIAGNVSFDQVRFRYRIDGPEVLKGVTLDIAAGEMIGIVGPSGSGKSTLTKLVQRLHTPERGRVLVDGVDLSLVDPAWLRRQVGVVLQENILFNRSVRENIALTDPAMPMDDVIRAATLAGAHDFILELPEAYDTRIDERGANLSGGQRQRIAIARALAVDPRILIFDEATSALDAESEEIIQNNLRLIADRRTVIIIAHRLSAVRQCHRIITVEKGEITETGTHEELLRRGGRYAALYTKQMGRTA